MRSALQAEGRRFESVNAHKMEVSFDASIFYKTVSFVKIVLIYGFLSSRPLKTAIVLTIQRLKCGFKFFPIYFVRQTVKRV